MAGGLVHRSTPPSLSLHDFLIRKSTTETGITKLPGFERIGRGIEFGREPSGFLLMGEPVNLPFTLSGSLVPTNFPNILRPFHSSDSLQFPIQFCAQFYLKMPPSHPSTLRETLQQRMHQSVHMARTAGHTDPEIRQAIKVNAKELASLRETIKAEFWNMINTEGYNCRWRIDSKKHTRICVLLDDPSAVIGPRDINLY